MEPQNIQHGYILNNDKKYYYCVDYFKNNNYFNCYISLPYNHILCGKSVNEVQKILNLKLPLCYSYGNVFGFDTYNKYYRGMSVQSLIHCLNEIMIKFAQREK